MPLPIIPFVAAGALVALVGAGSKEKAGAGSSTNAPGNVAPTQQSTGGDNGGAQAPSHSDPVAEPTASAGGNPVNGFMTLTPVDSSTPADPANLQTGGFMTAGLNPPQDPFAPDSTPSITKPLTSDGAKQAVLGIGATTVRQAGAAFATLGSAFGAVW